VSYAVNQFGDQLGVVALAVLVLDQTGSALATAGFFFAAKFLPAFAAPPLTAASDRLPPRAALSGLYAAESLLFVALALVASSAFSLPAILLLAFADGTLALTARALSRATTSALLRDRLREGNAVLNVAFAVSTAVGPAVAGVLVATVGVSATLAVDATSFAVVALLFVWGRPLPNASADVSGHWFSRLRAGLDYVRERPLLRALVGLEAIGFVFFTLVIPIEVVYAKETLEAGDVGFGVLLGAWGLGLVLGSALFGRFRDRPIHVLVGVSTLLVGVGYLGLAIAPGIVLACAASVVGGTGNGIQWVAVLTAVQEAVSGEFQARVVGLLESVGAAMPGVGYIIGGVVTSISSPRTAYLLAGSGVIAVAMAMTARLSAAVPEPVRSAADA
jgi:MFS family permease